MSQAKQSNNARRPKPPKLGWLAALVVLTLPACASPRHTDVTSFVHDPQPVVTATTYKMLPPDVVLITSKIVTEVNGHSEQISPDGKLTLPLLGSVFVAGRTADEVTEELRTRYRVFYKDCDINLRVVGYNSKKIYVWGEVGTAGPYPYNGTNTIQGTLAMAQPTRLAAYDRIEVLRPNKDGKLIRRMTIDLNKMVKEGDTSLDTVLEENDIIYVPPNNLAAVGLAFQQLLLPLQPAAATFNQPTVFQSTFNTAPYGSEKKPIAP